MKISKLKKEAEKELQKIFNLKDLNAWHKKYFGKKGEVSLIFSSLKEMKEKERKKKGEEVNFAKKELKELFLKKKRGLAKGTKVSAPETIDVTRPGKKVERGHLHPLTLIQREALHIFESMGFEVALGPEIETEWYNFDALNFKKNHPARDVHDTFWIDSKKRILLRTHTSPVQVRFMEKHNPPLKIVIPGRVFRNEATDSSHEADFWQLEGLMVSKEVSCSNFKAIIETFLERFFRKDVEIRLRPGYFPFTEPSFEIDAKLGKAKWLELMGAGMVHPNVFKASGLNPEDWQGFAFGVGLDRLAMIKYKIKDMRLFRQNDLRFLKQF